MYPYPSEDPTGFWAWYEAEVARRYAQAGRRFPDPNDAAAYRWFSRCGYTSSQKPQEQAAAQHLRELEDELGLTQAPPPSIPGDALVRPVQGYVRTEEKQWADDSGPRSFRICSWFPALRCYRDHREAAQAQLREIARYWHGVRVFWHVWSTPPRYSETYGVDPRWPEFDALLIDFLRFCASIGLRVSLASGDMAQLCPDGNEDRWHEHIAQLVHSVDQMTVSWFARWNEGWQNSANPDPAYAAALTRKVMAIYPWGAHGLSDPAANEEPVALDSWSRPPANFTLLHGTRVWPQCMNRAFNAKFEGHWLIDNDEPTGLGPDVYQPLANKHQLFGLYSLILITGQMLTYFSGHALTSWTPERGLSSDWGFRELPELWAQMNIPDAIASWQCVPGHYANAAVHPESYAVPHGTGPHRCDGAQSATRAFFTPCAGVGEWRLQSRWDADFRVWSADGLVQEGRVSAGQRIFTGHASMEALVIELNR